MISAGATVKPQLPRTVAGGLGWPNFCGDIQIELGGALICRKLRGGRGCDGIAANFKQNIVIYYKSARSKPD